MVKFMMLLVTVMFGANSVAAHSFNVLLIGDTADENGVYTAFRFATKERDGHTNEEADGHLGGLDVYISLEPDYPSEGRFDFAILLANSDIELRARLLDADLVLIDLSEISMDTNLEFVHSRQFERRYEAATGAAPDKLEILSYVAAQIVDKAVRAQDGVGDSVALMEFVAKY